MEHHFPQTVGVHAVWWGPSSVSWKGKGIGRVRIRARTPCADFRAHRESRSEAVEGARHVDGKEREWLQGRIVRRLVKREAVHTASAMLLIVARGG